MQSDEPYAWFRLDRLERDFHKLQKQRARGIITDDEFVNELVRVVHADGLPPAEPVGWVWVRARAQLALAFALATPGIAESDAFERHFGWWTTTEQFHRWYGACDARLGLGDPTARAELVELFGVGRPILRGVDRYPSWFQPVSAVQLALRHSVTEVTEWLWPADLPIETDTHPSCQFGTDTRHLCGEAKAVRDWLAERAQAGDRAAIAHLQSVVATGLVDLGMASAQSLPPPWRAPAMESVLRRMEQRRVVDFHLIQSRVRRDLPAGQWSTLVDRSDERGELVFLSFDDIAPPLTDPIDQTTVAAVRTDPGDGVDDAVFDLHFRLFWDRVWHPLHWGANLGRGLVITPDRRRRGVWLHVEDGEHTNVLDAAVQLTHFYEQARQQVIEFDTEHGTIGGLIPRSPDAPEAEGS